MSEDNRRAAIRWMEEIWNQRRVEVVDELMAPHATGHMEGAVINGPEDFRAMRQQLLTAFPDLHVHVEETIADRDIVALRWRLHGTHLGEAMDLKPSGRRIDAVGTTWFRFADGKIVEGRDTWNQGALFASLA